MGTCEHELVDGKELAHLILFVLQLYGLRNYVEVLYVTDL